MGECGLTRKLGAPLHSAPCCYVRASSPPARRPSGGSPERALKDRCGRGLASLQGVSTVGRLSLIHI
eukprot:14868251-Alexandrium_andersonii.AAC.1